MDRISRPLHRSCTTTPYWRFKSSLDYGTIGIGVVVDRDEETALQKLTNRVGRPFPFPSLVLRISAGVWSPSPLIVHYEHVRGGATARHRPLKGHYGSEPSRFPQPFSCLGAKTYHCPPTTLYCPPLSLVHEIYLHRTTSRLQIEACLATHHRTNALLHLPIE